MRILKFGGKSLGSLEKTQKICKFIKKIYKNDKNLIIVVSAMGQTTDNLLDMIKVFNADQCAKRELDTLLSCGETISASVFAIILNHYGIPAKSLQAWQVKINTMGEHQNSLITNINKSVIEDCLSKNTIPIITGFQGINKSNDITTLGRGGSDTTAAALGSVFNCNVEFYSDFNGVYSCDPRHIKSKKLNTVSLDQLDFLSQAGSKVISNRAVKIAKNNNLTFFLKSSSKPNLRGSLANNIENNNIVLNVNPNLCEICIHHSNELKLKFISQNVLILLKNFKIYNLSLKFNHISLLINQSDKLEILEILTKKLNL